MNKIDWYLLKQFILTALFGLVSFTIIFIAVDMMENLDDFIDRNATVDIIATYYFYFTPEILKLMTPVAMLLSALFTTGRLSAFNELTVLKSSGLSLYRFMAPLLIFSLLASGVLIYFNGWVVPRANKKKFSIARVYFQKNIEFVSKNNIFIQDSKTRILSINMFDDQRNMAYRVSIQDFDPQDLTRVIIRYDAAQMQWNQDTPFWTLVNGTFREFNGNKETITPFTTQQIGPLNFTPEDIRKKQERPEEMSYTDLKRFIHNQQRAGHEVARWLVDYYGKIAFPFASVIVVLFGVPFASVKRRSGPGVAFGIAIAICFMYMIFLHISQAFGYNGDLHPLLTAWLANIIFFVAGLYALVQIPK
ncbi:MAG: LptF/LptG family permease [Ignavibacteriae bacterium]|nr:LptF/LptG family permease [Ignavibacteriota bacterium]